MQQVGATLCSGAWASHCSDSFVAEMGSRHEGFRVSSTQAQKLWCAGSRHMGSVISACGLWYSKTVLDLVVVVSGLGCSVACGILLDRGSHPCPLHWQEDSCPLCHQQK